MFGQCATEPARLRHSQPAALGTRTADHIAQRIGVGRSESGGGQALVERLNRLASHPSEEDVLLDGQSHRAIAVRLGEIGKYAHLTGSEVTEWQADSHMVITVLTLLADVAAHPADDTRLAAVAGGQCPA